MAKWWFHSKTLTAFRRRYRLNRDPSEIYDGLLPVVQVDKHTTDDRLDLYGMLVQEIKENVVPNRYPSCTLQAGDKEVRVHEVTAWLDHHAWAYGGWTYHMMTPHPSYTPWAAYTYGAFYPWLQTRISQDRNVQLPDAFGVGGENNALQTVSIDGAPITCLGKALRFPYFSFIGAAGGGYLSPAYVTFWSMQDPPIRIKPYRQLMVQAGTAQAAAQAGMILNVNFIFSEGEFESDVG